MKAKNVETTPGRQSKRIRKRKLEAEGRELCFQRQRNKLKVIRYNLLKVKN